MHLINSAINVISIHSAIEFGMFGLRKLVCKAMNRSFAQLLAALAVGVSLTGCAVYRQNELPDAVQVMQLPEYAGNARVYIEERAESASIPMWHSPAEIGSALAVQFQKTGVRTKYVGLSSNERRLRVRCERDNWIASGIVVNGRPDAAYAAEIRSMDEMGRKIQTIQSQRDQMTSSEFWVECRTSYLADNFWISIPLAVVSGLTLTLIPSTECYSANVRVSVTDSNKKRVWEKEYRDSYRLVVWAPLVFSGFDDEHSLWVVPQQVLDNLARNIASEIVNAGVLSQSVVKEQSAPKRNDSALQVISIP